MERWSSRAGSVAVVVLGLVAMVVACRVGPTPTSPPPPAGVVAPPLIADAPAAGEGIWIAWRGPTAACSCSFVTGAGWQATLGLARTEESRRVWWQEACEVSCRAPDCADWGYVRARVHQAVYQRCGVAVVDAMLYQPAAQLQGVFSHDEGDEVDPGAQQRWCERDLERLIGRFCASRPAAVATQQATK